MSSSQKTILNFWFGELLDDATFPTEKGKMWFGDGSKYDETIRSQFGADHEAARNNKLDDWKRTPQDFLALIILLDQFSRHIYRDTPEAFVQDPQALALCLEGLQQKIDQQLKPVERSFFYLPLEHSEDLEVQKVCVEQFRKLVSDSPAAIEFAMANSLEYAVKHFDIINRFGRFPHRNKILGRKSTSEEVEFLKQPGSSF